MNYVTNGAPYSCAAIEGGAPQSVAASPDLQPTPGIVVALPLEKRHMETFCDLASVPKDAERHWDVNLILCTAIWRFFLQHI